MKVVEGKVREATVDMGAPILVAEKIPVDVSKLTDEVRAREFRLHGQPARGRVCG